MVLHGSRTRQIVALRQPGRFLVQSGLRVEALFPLFSASYCYSSRKIGAWIPLRQGTILLGSVGFTLLFSFYNRCTDSPPNDDGRLWHIGRRLANIVSASNTLS